MNLRFVFDCAPGDLVVFTAVIRDLARKYGNSLWMHVATNQSQVFFNNPYLYPGPLPNAREFAIDYLPKVRQSQAGKRLHFLAAMHELVGELLGEEIALTDPRPDLHLPAAMQGKPPVEGRYWVVLAGGKTDITVKHWYFHRYQAVVDCLRDIGISTVQTGKATDVHPPLKNVLNLVGWGGLLELFWLIYHADGVICPITCAMHVAAAFEKPCVVLAGGREEVWWESYTNEGQFPTSEPVRVPHTFLHTIGKLDCCLTNGCWKQTVTGGPEDKRCTNVVRKLYQPQAACQDLIDVEQVVNAVVAYYSRGFLTYPKPQAQILRFVAQ